MQMYTVGIPTVAICAQSVVGGGSAARGWEIIPMHFDATNPTHAPSGHGVGGVVQRWGGRGARLILLGSS